MQCPPWLKRRKITVKLDMTNVPMKTVMNEMEKAPRTFLYTDE